MLPINECLTTVNRTVYNNANRIKYIVIHYFGALGTAKGTCEYFKSVNRGGSAHYFVDDTSIWQCVRDGDASWHCGDAGKGTHKGLCTNANSIGIEMRPYKLDLSTLSSAAARDWYFNDATVVNTTELVLYLMKKYNIPASNVIRHYDVTAKLCPRPWVGSDINTHYKRTGNSLWAEFKAKLEDENMTGKEIYEKLQEYLKGQAMPSEMAKEFDEAIAMGITDGSNPAQLIPVWRSAILTKRAVKKCMAQIDTGK